MKLPSWFRIDTPVGLYNPDWAFVTEREEKLYFLRGARSIRKSAARRGIKRSCGRKNFEMLGVDFAVVTSLSEVSTDDGI